MIDDTLYSRRLSWDDARAFEAIRVDFFDSEEPGAVPLTLEVASVTERPAAAGHQFAIVFRGPREPLLAQRTYRVRHPVLGDFAIFVTPIGQTAQSTHYEACFSHVD